MCHCYDSLDDLSETERTDVLESHTEEELRAEFSEDELEQLGVPA